MRIEIRNLQRRLGTTSVFVTHDQLEAMTLADILVVMKDGGIEVLGPESLVHLHVPGVKDTIIAKVDTDPTLPITGPIEFDVDAADLHSFER